VDEHTLRREQWVPRPIEDVFAFFVRYVLPFGPLGRLAHDWIVKPDLEAIFDHRALRLAQVFGARSAHD
jgi:hypothetical protein